MRAPETAGIKLLTACGIIEKRVEKSTGKFRVGGQRSEVRSRMMEMELRVAQFFFPLSVSVGKLGRLFLQSRERPCLASASFTDGKSSI